MLKPKITLKQEECPAQIAAIAEETIKDSYPKSVSYTHLRAHET